MDESKIKRNSSKYCGKCGDSINPYFLKKYNSCFCAKCAIEILKAENEAKFKKLERLKNDIRFFLNIDLYKALNEQNGKVHDAFYSFEQDIAKSKQQVYKSIIGKVDTLCRKHDIKTN
jgi:hypothetical protein